MTDGRRVAQRYELKNVIGRGGMGRVWHAHDVVLGRDVAIKEIMTPEGLSSEVHDDLVRRTLREARACARLNHPNVVTIYDVVLEGGHPWMVMELLHARSLQEVIRSEGALPPERAAEIGLKVLTALTAAHTIGILHRDVKPSNILLTDDDRVLLTDFGIAVIQGEETITRTGALVGSAAYIAPERWLGQEATAAADLWALGVTLYEAVEGKPPFQRPEAIAIGRAVLDDAPAPSPGAGALGPVIKGLLRKTPGRRLTSVAVLPALAAVADSARTRLDPGSATRRLPSPLPAGGMPDLYPRGVHLTTCVYAGAALSGPLAALIYWQIQKAGSSGTEQLTDVLAIWSQIFAVAAPVVQLPMLFAYFLLLRPDRPRLSRAVLVSGITAAAATLAVWITTDTFTIGNDQGHWPHSAAAKLIIRILIVLAWSPPLLTAAAVWTRSKITAIAAVPAFVAAVTAMDLMEVNTLDAGWQTAARVAQAIFYGTWLFLLSRLVRSRAAAEATS